MLRSSAFKSWFTVLGTALIVGACTEEMPTNVSDDGLPGEDVVEVLEVAPSLVTLYGLDETETLSARVEPASLRDLEIFWESLDTTVVTVDASGRVQSRGWGRTRVRGRVRNGVDTVDVVVERKVASIAISPLTSHIEVGERVYLSAKVVDTQGEEWADAELRWSSRNPFIATVNSRTGRVRAWRVGEARITATSGDVTALATVRVRARDDDSNDDDSNDDDSNDEDSNDDDSNDDDSNDDDSNDDGSNDDDSNDDGSNDDDSNDDDSNDDDSNDDDSNDEEEEEQYAASITVSPGVSHIFVGETVKLTAEVLDQYGDAMADAEVVWFSFMPGRARVDATGLVTALSPGRAWILARSGSASSIATVWVHEEEDDDDSGDDGSGGGDGGGSGDDGSGGGDGGGSGDDDDGDDDQFDSTAAAVTVSPAQGTLRVGETFQLSALVRNAGGAVIEDAPLSWTSLSPSLASVNASGLVTASSAGTARIRVASGAVADTATLTIQEQSSGGGDLVVFPSADLALLMGPQVVSGASPWPFFDQNAIARGHVHGQAYPASPQSGDEFILRQYYDQALAQYINYYRTGDAAFLGYARKIADSWFSHPNTNPADPERDGSRPPRSMGWGGLILRALDGRPEMWPGIVRTVDHHWNIWLGMRLNNPGLHYGVRDGAFTLQAVAWLAQVHPDASVRNTMRQRADQAVSMYYRRLQAADGGWYWDIDDGRGHTTAQPFMVGMLLDALITVHQVTGNSDARDAILDAVDWLWEKAYDRSSPTNLPSSVRWRAMHYFVYNDGRNNARGSAALYGQSDGAIRDSRQLNPMTLQAFGYAYHLTGDARYRERGDEIFAATFGKGQGPLADQYWGLADFRAREYNQSYRTAGRHLGWRMSH